MKTGEKISFKQNLPAEERSVLPGNFGQNRHMQSLSVALFPVTIAQARSDILDEIDVAELSFAVFFVLKRPQCGFRLHGYSDSG